MSQDFGYDYDLNDLAEEDVGEVERIGTQTQKSNAAPKKRAGRPAGSKNVKTEATDATTQQAQQQQQTKLQPTITSAISQTQAKAANKTRDLDVESAIRSAYDTSADANDSYKTAQLLAQLADMDNGDDDEADEGFDVNAILGISNAVKQDDVGNVPLEVAPQPDEDDEVAPPASSVEIKQSPSTAASPQQKGKKGAAAAAAASAGGAKRTLFGAAKVEADHHQQQAAAEARQKTYTAVEAQERKLDPAMMNFNTKVEVKLETLLEDDAVLSAEAEAVAAAARQSSSATGAMNTTHKLPPPISAKERSQPPQMQELRSGNEMTLRNVYWIDAKEIQGGDSSSSFGGGSSAAAAAAGASMAGCVLLFGRIAVREPQSHRAVYKSICLRVPMTRCVMFLPRNPSEEADFDVIKEVTALCRKKGIDDRNFKFVQRMYAFEEEGVPTEDARWLKLRYSAAHPPLWGAKEAPPKLQHVKNAFGVNRSLLELLLIKRRFEGPGFLDVTHATAVNDQFKRSHCEFEFTCKSQKDIFVLNPSEIAGLPIPPKMTAASLHLRTQLDPTGKHHEIFAATIALCHFDTESSANDPPQCTPYIAVRSWNEEQKLPFKLRENLTKHGARNVQLCISESQLVRWVLETLHVQDPDIIIGHNIVGFSLGVLFNRIAELRPCQNWSTMGRMIWKAMPHGLGSQHHNKNASHMKGFWEKEISSGRMLVDTYALAKEYHRTSSYKLLSLARELDIPDLFGPLSEADVDKPPVVLDAATMLDADKLSGAIWQDYNFANLCVKLTHKLGLIPLTKRLAFVAGTVWSRVLNGSRAERIEYLLMHAFHRLKFVTPDKKAYGAAASSGTSTSGGGGASAAAAAAGDRRGRGGAADAAAGDASDNDSDDDDDQQAGGGAEGVGADAAAGPVRAKAKFKGGRVLEPQVGLYKDYILLLDFNSLYPSLIQEFNVCFTTVDRVKGVAALEAAALAAEPVAPTRDRLICANCAKLPNATELYPCPHRAILPKVIRSLVEGRRSVKALMKTERNPATLAQLEIRQKALKLTANSMYGCLGFSHSRFYAQKLAELVTQEGRRALAKTVEIVNMCDVGQRVRVIYGDTDSVMISTGEYDNLDNVKRIAEKIRKDVNKCYKHLELGMDGVFRTLLLHKKKKYAALTVTDWQGAGRTFKTEVKGLEMVRRDWCKISKEACKNVLDTALNPNLGDEVVETIGDALAGIADSVLEGRCRLNQFVIAKSIQRDPEAYKDAASQPHVLVALRMKKKSLPVFIGDLIPYVICIPPAVENQQQKQQQQDGAASATDAAASAPAAADNKHAATAVKAQPTGGTKASAKLLSERAFHEDEVKELDLAIDTQWYLATQIYPPVLRLCEHIEGFTPQFLCEKLKLPTSAVGIVENSNNNRFSRGGANATNNFVVAFRGMSLEDMYPNVPRFIVECPKCGMREPLLLHDRAAKMAKGEISKLPSNDVHIRSRRMVFNSTERTVNTVFRIPWFVCVNPHCKDQIFDAGIVTNTLNRTLNEAVMRLNSQPNPRSTEKFQQFYNHFSYLWRLFDVPPYILNDEERNIWNVSARYIDANGAWVTMREKFEAQKSLSNKVPTRDSWQQEGAKEKALLAVNAEPIGRSILERYLVHFQELTVDLTEVW